MVNIDQFDLYNRLLVAKLLKEVLRHILEGDSRVGPTFTFLNLIVIQKSFSLS